MSENIESTPDERARQSDVDSVLVAVDGSPANRSAIAWAVALAHREGRSLHLVTVVDDALRTSPYVSSSELDSIAEEILQEARMLVAERDPEMAVDSEKLFGHPSRTLHQEWPDTRIVVLGRRGRGGFARMALGSVSAAVGNHATLPTAIVTEDWDEEAHRDQPVIVGIDGSDSSLAALDLAADIADECGSELRLITCWGLATLFTTESVMAYGGMEAWRKDSEEMLATIAEGVRSEHPGLTITETACHAHPVAELSEASDLARLMVVGGHRAGRLHAYLVGSTTSGVLYHASCPVLVVPARR